MKKIVRKWGGNLVISFTMEDQKTHNIEEGDIVDLSDMTVVKQNQDEADMNMSNLLTKQRRDEANGKSIQA